MTFEKNRGSRLDRIDMHIEVPALPFRELSGGPGTSSAEIRAQVVAARGRQISRWT